MRLLNLCKKVCFLSAVFVVTGCVAQETSTANDQSAQSATVPLHLVDVVTMDMKTALPATNLQKDDFELYDNGQRVAVEAFASSVQYKARPLAIWFALICDQIRFEKRGSGFIRGNTKFFRPALDKLDKNDRVGVAHWCDDGSSAIDMALTPDRQKPLDAIEALMSAKQKMFEFTPGERAFRNMIQMIADASREPDRPVPVIIMVHGDSAGMFRKDLDPIRDLLLERSAFIFGLNDGGYKPVHVMIPDYEEPMLHWLMVETGGQWFSVKPEAFGNALGEIFQQLHFRYVLAFRPQSLDGARHELTVKLSEKARQQNKNVKLRYRPAYIAK